MSVMERKNLQSSGFDRSLETVNLVTFLFEIVSSWRIPLACHIKLACISHTHFFSKIHIQLAVILTL